MESIESYEIKIFNTVCSRNCYSGCGMRAHVQGGKLVKLEGNKKNPATYGAICQKGYNYFKMINSENRLLYPMRRTGERGQGLFHRISWSEAADTIFGQFKKASALYGPESILYYAASGNHGSAMQQYAYGFWYQTGGFSVTRGSLCAPAGNEAIRYTYGALKDSAIADIENSKLIILWGKNPAFTNFHTVRYINKAIEKGAKLVAIDPRLNESGSKACLHLFPRCGTDGLLALGLAKFIIEEGLSDDQFIASHTFGIGQYKELLHKYSYDYIFSATEVGKGEFEELCELIRQTPKFTLILGKGIQRYTNGGQTSRAIGLLPALTGCTGQSGSGLFYTDAQRPGFVWPYYPPAPENIRQDINIGRIATELTKRDNPPIKAMYIERANPITSNPNENKLREAMGGLDFIVCADQFMTDTAAMADIVLPVSMFLEENDLIYSYGHPYIQLKQKALDSPGECRTDKEIYHMLGRRFGFNMRFLPEDDEEILRGVISASRFDTTLEKLRDVPYLFPEYKEIAFSDMKFPTKSGKIEFYCEALHEDWGADPLPVYQEPEESRYSDPDLFNRYPLQFMSAHAKERLNSQLFGTERGVADTPVIHINIEDAAARNIGDGDLVRVYNDRGEILVKANVGTMVKPGVVNVFAGWWEKTGASVNLLSEDRDTDIGYGAAYHNCLVQAARAEISDVRRKL